VVTLSGQMVKTVRPYLCNFLGTIYKNSSRETLMDILKQSAMEKDCLMHVREKYVFMGKFHQSDFTGISFCIHKIGG